MSENKIAVLYIGLKFDYGYPNRGYSFEHLNFFDTLRRMSWCQVTFFPFDEIMREVGRDGMNDRLQKVVEEQKPQVCFFVLFTDEIKKETIRHITEKSGAITVNWFGDDHWRFDTFSKSWAPLFHWVVTTDSDAVNKYQEIGCKNIIKSQWAFNDFLYRRYDVLQDLNVTFVGQVHSDRKRILKMLMQAGVEVDCWGKGWTRGRLSQGEMIKTYARSKINLNFTESSHVLGWKSIAKVFLNRRADDTIVMNSPRNIFENLSMLIVSNSPQIKGRNFEIPGSGGFLITANADNLAEYFVPDKEVVVFDDTDDLIDKIRYYLTHDSERETIRSAGHLRALRDHTFEKRFEDIFRLMRLNH